jgi:hypothetical protein
MKNCTRIAFALVFSALALVAPLGHAGETPANHHLIAESSILAGLAPSALFPFIDSTPHHIAKAHIAITDSTSSCGAGAAAPSNIQILVGVAGGSLVNVMTAATNTGIGSATQCVFHVTITPGRGGVPAAVTDIVVVNANPNTPLTGVNTITVSATVR